MRDYMLTIAACSTWGIPASLILDWRGFTFLIVMGGLTGYASWAACQLSDSYGSVPQAFGP